MFNLLPNNLKEKVRSEYYLRLFVVIFVSVFLIQIFFLIFLSPTWFVSLNKEQEIVLQSEKANTSSLDQKVETTNKQIKSINKKLEIINSRLEYPRAIPVIDDILSRKTESITIKELMYETSDKKSGKVTLKGTSDTRDSLVSFVKNLEESDILEQVDLPISNLTKDKNIEFSLVINVVL
ncbi:MAG: hypothetical protein QG579_480 [Patescibacteria group bacterium]|jgi:Tfp pilus assembly protein PilN|nr:hypothetical protein [Patescibacteria group bacterium]